MSDCATFRPYDSGIGPDRDICINCGGKHAMICGWCKAGTHACQATREFPCDCRKCGAA
jgi:hypothetical protein